MQVVHIEMVHQLLGPGTVGERAAVVVSHDVTQLVEHDFAGIRIRIVGNPRILVSPEGRSSSQSDNPVSRVYQTHFQGPFLSHLRQHLFGSYLVVHTAVSIQDVFVRLQYLLVFLHVDHVGEVDEQCHHFAAVHRPDTHPVAHRSAVGQVRVAAVESEVDVPSVYYLLQLGPVWVIRFHLEFHFRPYLRRQRAYLHQLSRFRPVHAFPSGEGRFVVGVRKGRYRVKVGQVEIFAVRCGQFRLHQYTFQVARRVESGVQLSFAVDVQLQRPGRVEFPLFRVRIDRFRLPVLQDQGMSAFVVGSPCHEQGSQIVVRMFHPCPDVGDSVGRNLFRSEAVAALRVSSPVPAGLQVDVAFHRCTLHVGHEVE